MQPNTTIVKSMGDLGGTKVAMKFDENSIEHIMSVLTDLYSDPIAAVVREYSTNALDSHKASGQTRPVEVTLPSQFDPNFRVRDFGLGLSVDDVTNIYSQYGASTKRGTDAQTGMLGLGCKSGLTYADQFIINAVKNGVHVSVLVSRTESGAGVMEILDTLVTDEPNGVEIVIPTRIGDYSRFRDTVSTFFAYWPKGSVLIDGKPAVRFDETSNHIRLTDDLYLIRSMEDHRIVMGDVAYPLDFDKIPVKTGRTWRHYWALVAYVPMGSVNFTPSREQLHMTRLTQTTLDKIGADFDRLIVDKINEDIADAESHFAAWKKFLTYKDMFDISSIKPTYKGVEVPESIKISGTIVSYGKRNGIHRHAGFVGPNAANSVFVTGLETTSGAQRKIIRTWIEEKGHGTTEDEFYLVSEPITDPFLSDCINVDWETVKRETRKVRSAAYRKAAGTYPIAMPGANYETDSIIPDSDKIVWMRRSDKDYYHMSTIKSALGSDYHVVVLSENRVNKFNRDFSEVRWYKTVIRENLEGSVDPKNKYDRMRDRVDESMLTRIAKWDASKISDPAIATLISDCKQALVSKWSDKFANKVAVASKFGLNLLENDDDGACILPQEALAGYPFIAVDFNSYRSTWHQVPADHIYNYLNMVYEGTK